MVASDRVKPLLWSIEQREVDRVAHLAVPAVARVQPIAAIVDRPHLCRDLGVAKRSIEVGDAIESAGLADPFVDRNTVLLARRVPRVGHEGLVTERGKRRANQLDAAAMRSHGHLLQTGDHLLAGHLLVGLGPAIAQIVRAQHDDRVRHARLAQDVSVKPLQAAVAAQVV